MEKQPLPQEHIHPQFLQQQQQDNAVRMPSKSASGVFSLGVFLSLINSVFNFCLVIFLLLASLVLIKFMLEEYFLTIQCHKQHILHF